MREKFYIRRFWKNSEWLYVVTDLIGGLHLENSKLFTNLNLNSYLLIRKNIGAERVYATTIETMIEITKYLALEKKKYFRKWDEKEVHRELDIIYRMGTKIFQNWDDSMGYTSELKHTKYDCLDTYGDFVTKFSKDHIGVCSITDARIYEERSMKYLPQPFSPDFFTESGLDNSQQSNNQKMRAL